MASSGSSSSCGPSAQRLSFCFEGTDNRPCPLFARIGGGDKCLVTFAQTLFDFLYLDTIFINLYFKAQMALDPNYYYNYVLHITAKKPYDGELVRKTQAKLRFGTDHFNLLLKYIAKTAATLGLQDTVTREILEAAVTTKNDMRGKPLQSATSYW